MHAVLSLEQSVHGAVKLSVTQRNKFHFTSSRKISHQALTSEKSSLRKIFSLKIHCEAYFTGAAARVEGCDGHSFSGMTPKEQCAEYYNYLNSTEGCANPTLSADFKSVNYEV